MLDHGKIPQKPQTDLLTFFRMELCREDISPCDGASKRCRLIGGARRQLRVGRFRMIAVRKIESAAVVDAVP